MLAQEPFQLRGDRLARRDALLELELAGQGRAPCSLTLGLVGRRLEPLDVFAQLVALADEPRDSLLPRHGRLGQGARLDRDAEQERGPLDQREGRLGVRSGGEVVRDSGPQAHRGEARAVRRVVQDADDPGGPLVL